MGRRDYELGEQDRLAGKETVTLWGGFILFAGGIMILIGIFTVMMGCIALFDESWFVTPPSQVLLWGYNAWGWVHLIVGLFALAAGFGVIRGRTWARVMAVIVAGVNALSQLLFTSAYPMWSVIVIALDVIAIYALT